MKEIRIEKKDAGQRLDKYLDKQFPGWGRSLIYKFLRKKTIKLNGAKAAFNTMIAEGDILSVYISDESLAKLAERKDAAEENVTGSGRNTDLGKAAGAAKESCDGKAAGSGEGVKGEKSRKLNAVPAISDLSKFCSIVYEDDNIILADKRAGVLCQKADPSDISLNEALLEYCGGKDDSGFAPTVCNRIDRNTTGLVSFAKNYRAARELSELFRDRRAEKYYLAAVKGRVDAPGQDRAFIRKDDKTNKVSIGLREERDAKPIDTAWEPLAVRPWKGREISLLRVELITGKSHQIRSHLAYLGHPLLGDKKYGDRELNRLLKRDTGIAHQLLHAYELRFPDTAEGELTYLSGRSFLTEVPGRFLTLFPDMKL